MRRVRQSGRHRRAAFTLPECLVAMVVLVVCLATSWSLISTLLRLGAQTDNTSQATALAQGKIEDLLAQSYTNIVAGSDTVSTYTRKWAVDTSLATDTKLITVTVTWSELGGRQGSVTAKNLALK